ncbi:hypothetical protein K440DRAFT_609045 [Wilcoxina mikolae CBS 423.85]|nr:hypothetical protein K440DRAFT_609045 [Wilcoxina mikolae CBS 423.85]
MLTAVICLIFSYHKEARTHVCKSSMRAEPYQGKKHKPSNNRHPKTTRRAKRYHIQHHPASHKSQKQKRQKPIKEP